MSSLSRRLSALFDRDHCVIWRIFRRLGFLEAGAAQLANLTFQLVAGQLDQVDTCQDRALLLRTLVDVARTTRLPGNRLSSGSNAGLIEGSAGILDRVLSTLPFESAIVFVLFELEGVAISDVAFALRMTAAEVLAQVRLARALYRRRVQGLCVEIGRQGEEIGVRTRFSAQPTRGGS